MLGIRKKIDKLGRICIPKEMRTLFKLDDDVELLVCDDGIFIRKPLTLSEDKKKRGNS